MGSGSVLHRRQTGRVAILVMNRPERRNAIDGALLAALRSGLATLERDPSVGAVVLTGAGGAFSSGADLPGGPRGGGPAGAGLDMDAFARLYEAVTTFPKPAVAAIAGACIGAGAEMAACCDLRVGAPGATIRFPGAQFGVPVGAARLPTLIGISHAKDLLMTSRSVGGEEAYRIGFLNRLVPEAELEPVAVGLASALAALPGAAGQKQLVDEACGLTARARAESRALRRWPRP
jgi:enoyl-CoA hydratase/carnithine racemase